MKENQVSLTAIMTAYLRAYHAMNDTPKIFDDFLAYRLIPEERRALIEQGFSRALQINVPESIRMLRPGDKYLAVFIASHGVT